MTFLSIAALIIILVAGAFSKSHTVNQPEGQIAASPDVKGEVSEILPNSGETPKPTAVSSSSINTTNGKSNISINIDTHTSSSPTSEKLIFSGAVFSSQAGGKSIYETTSDAESVYNWYVSEMEKRGYTIRNKVFARAQDKISAVVAGNSSTSVLNVTIHQETALSKTQITL